MAVPFVQDPAPTVADDLGPAVLRLLGALYGRTVIREDGLPNRVGIATLARLATFDEPAVESAVASGFAALDGEGAGRKLRITPAGRSIFEAVEVEGDPSSPQSPSSLA